MERINKVSLSKEKFDEEFIWDDLKQKEKTDKITLQEGKSRLNEEEKFDLKFYHLNKDEEEAVFNQEIFNSIENITSVRHSNIIRIHDIYKWTEDNNTIICIKQEWTKNTLDKVLLDENTKFSQWECLMGLFSMFDALVYLNKKSMHHGNINPHNILIDLHGNWKMSEFYHSQKSQGSKTKMKFNSAGSNPSHYHSPKLQQASYDTQVQCEINGAKEDIWSLGLVLIRCITNKKDTDMQDLNIDEAKSKKEIKKLIGKLTNYWSTILTKMCAFDEELRYTLAELKTDMTTLGKIEVIAA